MIALDTNVLVRVMTLDDPAQARQAADRMSDESLWLPKTVLLETAWVLRASYGFDRSQIGEALERLLGLPQLQVEDAEAVDTALEYYASGLDFADALHLASMRSATTLVTFDRRFARAAARLEGAPPVELLGAEMPRSSGSRE